MRISCLCALSWLAYVITRNQTGLWPMDQSALLSPSEIRSMAQTGLTVLLVGLFFVVLSMTPALMAGVVVEEKQQRTLQELLTTRLTAGEILFAKLLAQWLQAGCLAALGIPLIMLTAPWAQADPGLLALIIAGLFSTCYLTGGMGILASTLGRRLNEAMFGAYALTVAWLVAPPVLIDTVMRLAPSPWPRVREYLIPVTGWMSLSSPFGLWLDWDYWAASGPEALRGVIFQMIGLQLAFGTAFLIVASAILRWVHGRQQAVERGAMSRWHIRSSWQPRFGRRPACGDDPLQWKERHVAKTSGLAKLGTTILMTASFLVLLAIVFRYFYPKAIREAWEWGYFDVLRFQSRGTFNQFLRNCGRALALVWLVVVALNMTDGWIRERLQDTWISLISTPMTGAEILKGKLLGSLGRVRTLGAAILGFFAIGVTTGAIHPLGFVLIALEFAALTWLAAVVCTYFFIDFRAKAGTMLLAGAGLFVLALVSQRTPYLGYLVKPDYVILAATLSVRDIQSLWNGAPLIRAEPGLPPPVYDAALDSTNPAIGCLFSLSVYAGLAFLFSQALFRNFDRMIGRPFRAEGQGQGQGIAG